MLFAGCTRSETLGLLTRFGVQRLTFDAGDVLVDERERPSRVGVLLSGHLHVYDSALKGQRHLVRIVRPGEVLGATLVGAQQRTYPALVSAHGDCTIAAFKLSALDKFQENGGGRFYRNLSQVLCVELQAAWRKIAMLSCPNIAERVMLYLHDRAQREGSKTVVIGSTEAEFADYLGVHRTALARVLRKLRDEGRLTYRRDVFTLA